VSRILVAVDGSDAAAEAACKAVELLGRDHRYTVLEAIEVVPISAAPGLLGTGPAYETVPSPEMLMAETQRATTEARNDVAVAIRRMRVGAHPIVEFGHAAEVIAETVRSNGIDVVVVGSHGKGLAERVFHGSVSHEVLKDLPCPVLVIPITR